MCSGFFYLNVTKFIWRTAFIYVIYVYIIYLFVLDLCKFQENLEKSSTFPQIIPITACFTSGFIIYDSNSNEMIIISIRVSSNKNFIMIFCQPQFFIKFEFFKESTLTHRVGIIHAIF